MKSIKFNRSVLGRDFIEEMIVDEKDATFTNHTAIVHATVFDKSKKNIGIWLGVINEDYEEITSNKKDSSSCSYLCFSDRNFNIVRIYESDFLVQTRTPYRAIDDTKTRHIRVVNGHAVLMYSDISDTYTLTNDKNILITGFYQNQLYDLSEGKFLTRKYDSLSTIDGCSDRFLANDILFSSDGKFLDHLAFEIDKNGHTISKVLSAKVGDYLDYGETISIDDYSFFRKRELLSKRERKGKIYVFEDYKRSKK